MKVFLLMMAAMACTADTGVIIPSNRQQPDPKILSLAEMDLDVLIDNQTARVRIRQIFQSHNAAVLEGRYIFALPDRAMVSDFAVWDDVVRIPGVILERRRAEEIYENLKMQAIDPGLLQQGDGDAGEARRNSLFSARIVPIPGFGTKRLEMEYHQRIPVDQLQSMFAIALRPDVYNLQVAGRLGIRMEVRSRHPIRDFEPVGRSYALKTVERTPNRIRLSFEGSQVNLSEDLAVKWTFDAAAPKLEILTHRQGGESGYFQASLLTRGAGAGKAPRTVVALFDASLSMQWEKLERCYQALEALLRSLRPADRFSLIVYNSEARAIHAAPVPATPAAVDSALAAVKDTRLRGGTNLQAALEAALKQTHADDYLVLLGDGGATRGIVHNGKLAAWYQARRPPHTYVFGVGDDANLPLLKMLARSSGLFEWVRSTEPIEFKLRAFLAKIGVRPIEGLTLAAEPAANFDFIYPLEENVFPGSVPSWIGQYKKPGQATFRAGGLTATSALPETGGEHAQLPRTWAKARVDALLEKIERDGEDRDTIDEIIRLSRRYKFVTPYTSFLAAPRALLRPRLIRPGDPVLRVRTDESITSVIAMFPFGLVKPLRYLSGEGAWQTRFLAPSDMADGTYQVQLILRDRQGRTFRESKSFVIASRPPIVRVKLEKARYRRGETIPLHVAASASTRTIVARMMGAAPVHLRWNAEMKSNTGAMVVPAHLAAGRYKLMVTAEDFAHNIGTGEVQIEVLP
ncbi:MAG: VIT and VWA domain-containing protein [Bryobacteraceae bacterium]|nr:VIT and VWA domain-containing protein [Bryobacteraceae bacterium]